MIRNWTWPAMLALVACGGPPTDDGPIEETSPADTQAETSGGDTGDQPKETQAPEDTSTPTDTPEDSDHSGEPGDSGDTDEPTDTAPTDPSPTGTTGTDTGLQGTGVVETGTATETDTGTPFVPGPCTYDMEYFTWPQPGAPDLDFYLYDESGNEVYADTWSSGNAHYDTVTLGTGRYYSVIRKDGSTLWDPIGFMDQATLSWDLNIFQQEPGFDVQWHELSCPSDAATLDTAWTEPETPPTLPAIWEDDGTHGDCTFALQIRGTYDNGWTDAQEPSFAMYDEERNLLASRAPGLIYNDTQETEILNLSNGRYLVEMHDAGGDGWNGGHLRLVDGTGDIVEVITLESGDEGMAYLNIECDGDTSAYEPWDTDPDVTDIDTAWYRGEAFQGCPIVLAVHAPNNGSEMDYELLDATGNVLRTSADDFPLGIATSEDEQYVYSALPSGDYQLKLIDNGFAGDGWGTWPYLRVYGDLGAFLGGGGHHGPNTDKLYSFSVDCEQDTAQWYAGDVEDLVDDTAWDLGGAWADTDVPETCGYMMEVYGPWDATQGAWEIHDLEGHKLYEILAGDMTLPYAIYRTPVQLPTGGYKLIMKDGSGQGLSNYNVADNFVLRNADGDEVGAWNMGGYGVSSATEYFSVDCADDSASFAWDTAWCEPVTDTSAAGASACGAALKIVAGSWNASAMTAELWDADGNLLLEVESGDIAQSGEHYFPVDMPSGGYHLAIGSSDGTVWPEGAYAQLVSLDGQCAGDALGEAWTLTAQNGLGGERDIWFTHDCEADTAGFAWDSGWCEPVLDTAEMPSGDCGYVARVQGQFGAADMQITLKDSSGAQVWSMPAGTLSGQGVTYFPLNLPSDGYEVVMESTNPYNDGWAIGENVQFLPTEDACVDQAAASEVYALESGWGGTKSAYFTVDCAEDSADFAWDSGWCEPVLDTADAVTSTCGMVARIHAGYDFANYVATLTDADGNVILDIQAGDLTSQGYHHFPIDVPTSGYELYMATTSTWGDSWDGRNGWIQLIPASGTCVDEDAATEKFRLEAFGERTEYLTIDCPGDSGDFAWDSGWCADVIDTADLPAGSCGHVIEVGAGYDYGDMDIQLEDADGNSILSISPGDGQIDAAGIYRFPVDLPTDGYVLTLTDASQWVSNWAEAAYVQIIPLDGGCMDRDLAGEKHHVRYGGEEVVYFEVDCAADSGDFAWDSGFCDVLFEDTAGTGGLSGCQQLLNLTTWYDPADILLEITDDAGLTVFSVDGATDLAYQSEYFFAVDLPTGDYTATLTDRDGDGWSDSPTVPAQATLYAGNGVCMGTEVLAGPWTVEDQDGFSGVAETETFTFSVVCESDTAP